MYRRELLRISLYVGTGLLVQGPHVLERQSISNILVSGDPRHSTASAGEKNNAPALANYVDPLPIPRVIRASQSSGVIQMPMRQFHHKAHRDLPPTTLWGYDGTWPGPTLEVRRGQPL